MYTTDNYRKHTVNGSLRHLNFFQRILINRFFVTLLTEIKLLQPKSILDVGCGEGFTLQKLKDNNVGNSYEGVDVLKTALAIGRKIHPDLPLKFGDIYKLPYKNNSFDVVICTEVLEHLTDPGKALGELHRVSKKYCIISVPNEPWFMLGNFLRGKNMSRWGNDIEHINHWTSSGTKRFVQSKFIVKKILTPLPWTIIIGEK